MQHETQETRELGLQYNKNNLKYVCSKRVHVFAGMTKRMYVETVLEGIKQCQEEGLDIDVR